MTASVKLLLFGVGLAAVFGVAYFLGGVFISDSFVEGWISNTH